MLKKVLKFAEEFNMLPRGGMVLAAVSGGADSMCMLHLLSEAGEQTGFTVGAMHFNHCLRGAESDRDEEFVRDFCRGNDIPFFPGRGNVAARAAETGRGTEETAREMRYAFFYETAEKTGAARIATAHTADDNAETLLMRIARGTGLKGLCGIPPVRGIIIRPLLPFSRLEVEEYLRKNGISHVEDSTNSHDIYTRNKIRHHVVPIMKGINPGFCGAVDSLTRSASEDEALINSMAADFIRENSPDGKCVSADSLVKLPNSVSRRVIRKLSKGELSFDHTDSVLAMCRSERPSATLSLPGVTVRREYDKLLFCSPSDIINKTIPAAELTPERPVRLLPQMLEISCEEIWYDGQNTEINNSLNTYLFEKSKIYGKLFVRARAPGDKLSLSGRNVTKSLKKLFIENRVPASERDIIPVVADDHGPLCVYKTGADKRAAVSRGHKCRAVKITFKEIS